MVNLAQGHQAPHRAADIPVAHNLQKYMEIIDYNNINNPVKYIQL